MFDFLKTLGESRQFRTSTASQAYSSQQLAKMLFLTLLSYRILFENHRTRQFAIDYLVKTTHWNSAREWRNDGTDLYVLCHAFEKISADSSTGYHLTTAKIFAILKDFRHAEVAESRISRFFLRLDYELKISDTDYIAMRRLVIDWGKIDDEKKLICIKKLKDKLRAVMANSEMFEPLAKVQRDITDAFEDTYEAIEENATSGATGAGSVATCIGGLGAGFDTSEEGQKRSIYWPADHPKKAKSKAKPLLIRR